MVIVQDDRFAATSSLTVCPLTTDPTEAPLLRIPIEADLNNGLTNACSAMADKLTTMPRTNLHTYVGRLSDEDMLRLSRAAVVFLGLV